MDCGSVTFVFSSNKPEVVGGVDVPCMSRFSNNLCGSDLYIIYCLINSGVQTCASGLAPSIVTPFLVPVLFLMNCPFACVLFGWCISLSERGPA